MRYSKIVTSMMLSTVLLSSAGTVLADQVKPTSETNVSQKDSSKKNETVQNTKPDSSKDSSNVAQKDESGAESATNDPVQTLKEQTMVIKKVIAKGGSQMATVTSGSESSDKDDQKSPGIAESSLKGVPNSKFVVYDVTELMNTIIKEKLGIDDKQLEEVDSENVKHESSVASTNGENSSESKEDSTDNSLSEKVRDLRNGDSLRKEISERASKLNNDQLKNVAEVTTDDSGAATVKLPIDGKYHAYYVVNTETAKESYATNASPIVVITPVTENNGEYASEFTIYPKSDEVPKESEQGKEEGPQKTETTATMYQTGHKDRSLFSEFVSWVKGLFK
ncbi:pilin N-terminal domain-containing protein [Ligilactobacillus murinus]|uniref:pilin N-terminal domain-containing protein n=1 Tax=Ligilactobacillus murinus TaxID=1622 RepID=UPI001C3E2078|nr:pilin N-terminal domain-containing protein [Ligilactobacillus murinus]